MANLVATVTATTADVAGMRVSVDLALASAPSTVIASNTFLFKPLTPAAEVQSNITQWMALAFRKKQWATAVSQTVSVGTHINLTV